MGWRLIHFYVNIIIGGDQLCSEMEVLELHNVTKSFVPKFDVKGDQDCSQTDEELPSKVLMHACEACIACPNRKYLPRITA